VHPVCYCSGCSSGNTLPAFSAPPAASLHPDTGSYIFLLSDISYIFLIICPHFLFYKENQRTCLLYLHLVYQVSKPNLIAIDQFLFFFSIKFLLIDPGSVSGIHIFQIPVTCPLFDTGMDPAYCCGWQDKICLFFQLSDDGETGCFFYPKLPAIYRVQFLQNQTALFSSV
jgi:hypothetical protein